MIYSTGKVIGTVRYGKIVIEEGGELAGDSNRLPPAKCAGLVAVAETGQHKSGYSQLICLLF